MKKLILPAITAALLSVSTSAHAVLVAYDGFSNSLNGGDYAFGDLSGQNPSPGQTVGFSGAWTNAGWTGSVNPTASNLTYPGFTSGATAGDVTRTGGNTAENQRDLSSVLSSGTYYVSFLVNSTSATGFGQFAAYGSASNYYNGGDFFSMGVNDGTFNVDVNNDGNRTNFGTVTAGQTYLMVAKLTMNGGVNDDAVSVWVNPSSLGSESGSGAAQFSTSTTNVRLAALGFRKYGTGDITFDEMRVGTTWADVTTVPEPATWALLAGGLTCLVVFRRRRSA